MATQKPKDAAMCCVTIDYVRVLLPADAGLKVVQLLREAVECKEGFDADSVRHTYEPGDVVRVEYCNVKASQLRWPKSPAPSRPLAIAAEPLKLGHVPSIGGRDGR